MVRTRAYRRGILDTEDFPLEQISDFLADDDTVVWIDLPLDAPGDLEVVADELSLHRLAVEDARKGWQRPKVDRYATHLFVVTHQVQLDPVTGQLEIAEVACFVTRHALVTVRAGGGIDLDAVLGRWDGSTELAGHGVAFLLHGLLDHVIDTYFTVATALDEEADALEDLLFTDRPRDREVHRRAFALRKNLVLLRRLVMPLREVVNALLRRDLTIVDDAMAPYYQDLYDHVLRVSEWTESLRDLVASILETNVTIQGNQLNTIMKQITGWAAIVAVPTAISGFYGQNVPFPGFGQPWGFQVSSGVTLLASVALYVVFRLRRWL